MAALVAVMATPAAVDAACRMAVNAELDVRFLDNRPLVEASVNGRPVWLLLDTGSTSTLLFETAAEHLGLKTEFSGEQTGGFGGLVESKRARIAEFAVQNAKVKGFPVMVAGGARLNVKLPGGGDREVAGLLGLDFLAQGDIEFDLKAHKVRLLTFHDCERRSLAYWSDAPSFVDMGRNGAKGEYLFPLKINGIAMTALMDSGARLSTISPDAARHAGVVPAQYRDPRDISGIGGKLVRSWLGDFQNFDLGDEKIARGALLITPMSAEENGADMPNLTVLLGADFLHAHRVLLAGSQDRIYFTYEGGPVFGAVSTDAEAH